MTGFAKEYNTLFQNQMVNKMIASVKEIADENDLFDIQEVVGIIKGIWR